MTTPDIRQTYKYGLAMKMLWHLFNRHEKPSGDLWPPNQDKFQFNTNVSPSYGEPHTIWASYLPYLNSDNSAISISDPSALKQFSIKSGDFLGPFYDNDDINSKDNLFNDSSLRDGRLAITGNTLEQFQSYWNILQEGINDSTLDLPKEIEGKKPSLVWKWDGIPENKGKKHFDESPREYWEVGRSQLGKEMNRTMNSPGGANLQGLGWILPDGYIDFSKINTKVDSHAHKWGCHFGDQTHKANWANNCTVSSDDLRSKRGQEQLFKRLKLEGGTWIKGSGSWPHASTRNITPTFQISSGWTINTNSGKEELTSVEVIDDRVDDQAVTKSIDIGFTPLEADENGEPRVNEFLDRDPIQHQFALEFCMIPGYNVGNGEDFKRSNKVEVTSSSSVNHRTGTNTKDENKWKHEGGFDTTFKYGSETETAFMMVKGTWSFEAEASQFQKWAQEENKMTEIIDEISINNTEGSTTVAEETISRTWNTQWTTPSEGEFEKWYQENNHLEKAEQKPMFYRRVETGKFDENGDEIILEAGLWPNQNYTYLYQHHTYTPIIPPMDAAYEIRMAAGNLGIDGNQIADTSVREAIKWAKRGNFREVLGYDNDPFMLSESDKGLEAKVIVDSEITMSLEDIVPDSTVKLLIVEGGTKPCPPTNSRGRVLDPDEKFSINQEPSYRAASENVYIPGKLENYKSHKGDITMRDNRGDGFDIFELGSGDDRLVTYGEEDSASLGSGNDRYKSTKGQKSISVEGEKGNDLFIQNANLGNYKGGHGKDTLKAKSGLSFFNGGKGRDKLVVSGSNSKEVMFNDFEPGIDRIKTIDNNNDYKVEYIQDLGLIKATNSNNTIKLYIGQESNPLDGNTDHEWRELALANPSKLGLDELLKNSETNSLSELHYSIPEKARSTFIDKHLFKTNFKLITPEKFQKAVHGNTKKGKQLLVNLTKAYTENINLNNTETREIAVELAKSLSNQTDLMMPSEIASEIENRVDILQQTSNNNPSIL